MSIGVGAHADLYVHDNETVIYKYGGYNLNIPEYRNEERIYDGIITIIQAVSTISRRREAARLCQL